MGTAKRQRTERHVPGAAVLGQRRAPQLRAAPARHRCDVAGSRARPHPAGVSGARGAPRDSGITAFAASSVTAVETRRQNVGQFGGASAAPAWSEIMQFALMQFGVPPTDTTNTQFNQARGRPVPVHGRPAPISKLLAHQQAARGKPPTPPTGRSPASLRPDRSPGDQGWRVLHDLLDGLELGGATVDTGFELRGDGGIDVRSVDHDSRQVAAGRFSVVFPRAPTDTTTPAAVAGGAVACLVERWLALDVPQARVRSVRGSWVRCARAFTASRRVRCACSA